MAALIAIPAGQRPSRTLVGEQISQLLGDYNASHGRLQELLVDEDLRGVRRETRARPPLVSRPLLAIVETRWAHSHAVALRAREIAELVDAADRGVRVSPRRRARARTRCAAPQSGL